MRALSTCRQANEIKKTTGAHLLRHRPFWACCTCKVLHRWCGPAHPRPRPRQVPIAVQPIAPQPGWRARFSRAHVSTNPSHCPCKRVPMSAPNHPVFPCKRVLICNGLGSADALRAHASTKLSCFPRKRVLTNERSCATTACKVPAHVGPAPRPGRLQRVRGQSASWIRVPKFSPMGVNSISSARLHVRPTGVHRTCR